MRKDLSKSGQGARTLSKIGLEERNLVMQDREMICVRGNREKRH